MKVAIAIRIIGNEAEEPHITELDEKETALFLKRWIKPVHEQSDARRRPNDAYARNWLGRRSHRGSQHRSHSCGHA